MFNSLIPFIPVVIPFLLFFGTMYQFKAKMTGSVKVVV